MASHRSAAWDTAPRRSVWKCCVCAGMPHLDPNRRAQPGRFHCQLDRRPCTWWRSLTWCRRPWPAGSRAPRVLWFVDPRRICAIPEVSLLRISMFVCKREVGNGGKMRISCCCLSSRLFRLVRPRRATYLDFDAYRLSGVNASHLCYCSCTCCN